MLLGDLCVCVRVRVVFMHFCSFINFCSFVQVLWLRLEWEYQIWKQRSPAQIKTKATPSCEKSVITEISTFSRLLHINLLSVESSLMIFLLLLLLLLFVSLWHSFTGAAQHSYTGFNKKTLLLFYETFITNMSRKKKKSKKKKKGGEQMKQELVDYNKILPIFIYFN